jgi:glycosyltransferase involved in cell wall biosynthesis
MLASVVLPCFNGASTLSVMFDSLVHQTYKGDWELVFVNNGSTDNSVEIAERYRNRLPALRIVQAYSGRGPRGNVGHSYTCGFRAARGDLILVCESDDELDPHWMEEMVKALGSCDFAVPSLDYEKLNPPALTWGQDKGKQSRSEGLPSHAAPLYLPFAVCNAIGMTQACYRRVGDPTDWIGPPWDIDYSWRVQLAGMKLTFVPEALVHYRLRHDAGSRWKQAVNWGKGQLQIQLRYGMAPWPRFAWHALSRVARTGLRLAIGVAVLGYSFAYGVWDLGFAWGELQTVPDLIKAQMQGVKPDAEVLAGKQPSGPQTYAEIPGLADDAGRTAA